MHIFELKEGTRARLIDFGETDIVFRRRLLSLGITRGVEMKLVRIAPLGCPYQVEIRGTALCLRLDEAALLEWELM